MHIPRLPPTLIGHAQAGLHQGYGAMTTAQPIQPPLTKYRSALVTARTVAGRRLLQVRRRRASVAPCKDTLDCLNTIMDVCTPRAGPSGWHRDAANTSAAGSRLRGTGSWIFEHADFQAWSQENNSLLWLYGPRKSRARGIGALMSMLTRLQFFSD